MHDGDLISMQKCRVLGCMRLMLILQGCIHAGTCVTRLLCYTVCCSPMQLRL